MFKLLVPVVAQVTCEHLSTLLTKRRMKLYVDDYGQVIAGEWLKELEYFYERVCLPVMIEACMANGFTEFDAMACDADAVIDAIDSLVADEDQRRSDDTQHANVEGMSPEEYEHHCAAELTKAGWSVRVTAGSGDQGVDVVGTRQGGVAVFQCKLYGSPVGNSAVQQVHAGRAFYRADIAAVISNADYTPGARAAAMQTNVLLLHHSELSTFNGRKINVDGAGGDAAREGVAE